MHLIELKQWFLMLNRQSKNRTVYIAGKNTVVSMKSPHSVDLPLQNTANTHAYFVLCKRPGPKVVVVPAHTRFTYFLEQNILISSGTIFFPFKLIKLKRELALKYLYIYSTSMLVHVHLSTCISLQFLMIKFIINQCNKCRLNEYFDSYCKFNVKLFILTGDRCCPAHIVNDTINTESIENLVPPKVHVLSTGPLSWYLQNKSEKRPYKEYSKEYILITLHHCQTGTILL